MKSSSVLIVWLVIFVVGYTSGMAAPWAIQYSMFFLVFYLACFPCTLPRESILPSGRILTLDPSTLKSLNAWVTQNHKGVLSRKSDGQIMAAYTPTAEIVDRLKVIRPIKEPIDSCRPALFFAGGEYVQIPYSFIFSSQ